MWGGPFFRGVSQTKAIAHSTNSLCSLSVTTQLLICLLCIRTWSTIVIYVSDTAQCYWKVWYAAFLSISLSCHLCKLNGKICQQLFHCLAIPSSILVYVKDVHQTNSLHLWRSQLNIESCLCQAKCFHEWLCRNTCKNCNTDPIHAQYIKADHNPTPTLNSAH